MKKWIRQLKDMLYDLGLYYDQSYAGDGPALDKDSVQSETRTKHKLPDNVRTVKGIPYEFMDKADGRDWELYRKEKIVSRQITDMDYEIIERYGLDELKYTRIKELLSDGLSIKEISDRATDLYGSGFKRRTIQAYVPRIKEAATPLPEHERGGAPQTAAKT